MLRHNDPKFLENLCLADKFLRDKDIVINDNVDETGLEEIDLKNNKKQYVYSNDTVFDAMIVPSTLSFFSKISQTLSSMLPGAWR